VQDLFFNIFTSYLKKLPSFGIGKKAPVLTIAVQTNIHGMAKVEALLGS
jgi:hypothetical protein